MQINIMVEDKAVAVDGVGLFLNGLDWSPLNGDPANPFDDIRSVHFDTGRGVGTVTFKMVPTKQFARPDITPPDWTISKADFERDFGWILTAYDAERVKVEAANLAAIEAATEAAKSAPSPTMEGASPAMQEAMMIELLALKAANEQMQKQIAAHTQTFQALGDIDLAKP